jgi:hypothetical protein
MHNKENQLAFVCLVTGKLMTDFILTRINLILDSDP